MPLSHRFRELTWPEVNEAVRHGPCLLIPVGAIEQHGPHLPVDVDNAITEHICDEAARRSGGDVLVMPAVHYGYNDHNMDFPVTISIRMEHFIAIAWMWAPRSPPRASGTCSSSMPMARTRRSAT